LTVSNLEDGKEQLGGVTRPNSFLVSFWRRGWQALHE